jgi:hypothetical protein
MPYHIIVRFIVMSRVSNLDFPLTSIKLLRIETKRAANSFRTSSSALRPLRSIDPIIVVTTPIATETNIPISSRADNSDSVAIRYGILLDRSKQLLSSVKDLFH